jgi:hypothetical protein
MKKFPQVIKSAKGNVLQIGRGFPYNPKVSRTKAIPGEALRGAPEAETQARSLSEENWE